MSDLADWLAGGDLRSDGPASEVAALVVANPHLVPNLVAGLDSEDAVIRGRSADALEKVARSRPHELLPWLPRAVTALSEDPVPMVRFHLAMLLGHLSSAPEHAEAIASALVRSLRDESAFTRSWAITSLLLVARQHPTLHPRVVEALTAMPPEASRAVASRLERALALLADPNAPLPGHCVKSEHLQDLTHPR